MELSIKDLRLDGSNTPDIVIADDPSEVIEFVVKFLQSKGAVLVIDDKTILPGSVLKPDKGVV